MVLHIIMKTYIMFNFICYLNICFVLQLPSSSNKHEEFRKKINKMLRGKEGEKMFLNTDEYEYPRSNESLKQIHKQQWSDYYKCLKEIYAGVSRERIIYPNALIALQGTSVTLKCQICISPTEMHISNLIQWYFNSTSSSSSKSDIVKNNSVAHNNTLNNIAFTIIEDTDCIVSSPDKQYIIMYNLKLEQTGLYWCEMGDTVGSVYFLHIDNDFETTYVYPETAIYAPQAASVRNIPEYDLKVYTTWTTWSSCSTCNVVGVKLRYGYCTVSLLETSVHNAYIVNETRKHEWNEMVESTNRTTIVNENLKLHLRMTLSLFKNKLPCKSRFVPKQIQIIPAIKNRKIEVMKRYCKKKCQKNTIFEIRDEKGNVLESANNSADIYSMIQRIPKTMPSIKRNVLYKKHNKKLKLVCPENLNADIPIIWQFGDKLIIPSHIKNQSNGRIYINPQMEIIFQSLKFNDANIYSCWQNNKLVGIIKLNVIEEIEFKINHHIILIGAIVIISIFLIIFWRVFKGRTRYTIH